jgi:hypothetical protein
MLLIIGTHVLCLYHMCLVVMRTVLYMQCYYLCIYTQGHEATRDNIKQCHNRLVTV